MKRKKASPKSVQPIGLLPPTDGSSCQQRSEPKTLADWIQHYESEFMAMMVKAGGKWPAAAAVKLDNIRRMAQIFDFWCWGQVDEQTRKRVEKLTGDQPPEKDFMIVKLSETLLILWADATFWKLIRIGLQRPPPPPHTIDSFVHDWVLDKYRLTLPFSAAVWVEMVSQPVERVCLFQLLTLFASKFFWVQSVDPRHDLPEEWRHKLSRAILGDLFHKYVHNPGQDWRHEITLAEYPEDVLERLHTAVRTMADDIDYVRKHPGHFDAQRAPAVAHRTRSLQDTHRLEQMVTKLREDPEMTDYSLAKQCLGSISGSRRKLAREAKLLGLYREAISITIHPSKGKKP